MNKRDPNIPSDEPAGNDGEMANGEPGSPPSTWKQAAAFRFVGLGTELAGFTLVIAGLGYLLDTIAQNPKPYGTAIGALIGFGMGMVRFIQQVQNSDDH